MLSALLTGVNRAFPYAKGIKQQRIIELLLWLSNKSVSKCGFLDVYGRSIESLSLTTLFGNRHSVGIVGREKGAFRFSFGVKD